MISYRVISLNREAIHLNNLNFEFFDAIDNRKKISKFDFNKDVFKTIYGRDATNGEKGCSLSHFEVIYDFFYNDENEFLVILEDDAILEGNFINVVNSIIDNGSSSSEIYLLGFSKTKKTNNFIHRLKWPLINKRKFSGVEFGFSDNNKCGTVCYLINKNAARCILNNKEIYWLADEWSFIKNMGVDVFYPNKPVVYEDFMSSSTTGNEIKCMNSFYDYFYLNIKLVIKGVLSRIINVIKIIRGLFHE